MTSEDPEAGRMTDDWRMALLLRACYSRSWGKSSKENKNEWHNWLWTDQTVIELIDVIRDFWGNSRKDDRTIKQTDKWIANNEQTNKEMKKQKKYTNERRWISDKSKSRYRIDWVFYTLLSQQTGENLQQWFTCSSFLVLRRSMSNVDSLVESTVLRWWRTDWTNEDNPTQGRATLLVSWCICLVVSRPQCLSFHRANCLSVSLLTCPFGCPSVVFSTCSKFVPLFYLFSSCNCSLPVSSGR